MATFGYSTTPTFGWFQEGASTGNQIGALFSMPSPGGSVTALSAYAGTYSGSSTSGYLVMWSGSGTVLASVAVTIPGSPAWVSGTLSSSVYVASGQSVFIGWATPASVGFKAEYNSVGGASLDWNESASIPGSLAGHTNVTGEQLGAYATYTPLTVPTVSAATSNPVIPGGTLTLTGTGFQYATAVTIGGTSCSFTASSDTSMTVTVPSSGVSGTQNLIVTNPAGSSSAYSITVGGIARIWNGSAWVQGVVYVYSGSAWVPASNVQVWNGSAWVNAS